MSAGKSKYQGKIGIVNDDEWQGSGVLQSFVNPSKLGSVVAKRKLGEDVLPCASNRDLQDGNSKSEMCQGYGYCGLMQWSS